MKINQASLKDLNELNDLFDGYRVFYDKKSDKIASNRFLKARIENKDSVIFISRDEAGIATGFTQLYTLFSSTRMKRVWLLNDLYVDLKYRGLGISKVLIERAKEYCKENDGAGLTLETAKDNHIGNQLYPSTGWVLDEDHNYYIWETD